MYIILADDEKYQFLSEIVKELFTENYKKDRVFIYDHLLDAVYHLEDNNMPHIDVGLFDLNFVPQAGSSKIASKSCNVKYEGDVKLGLMGVNCLTIAIIKAKERRWNFVGTLYTFYPKDQLRSQSLDLRIFLDYQLPQWEKEGKAILWSSDETKYENEITNHIKKLLRTARIKNFSIIKNYTEFIEKVKELRSNISALKKPEVMSKINNIKNSLKFESNRDITFETFFPELEKPINNILENAIDPSLPITDVVKEKLLNVLNTLILDWRPYTSLLTKFVKSDGICDKKAHGADNYRSEFEKLKEFEMLPICIIKDIEETDKYKDYWPANFASHIESKLNNDYKKVNDQYIIHDRYGNEHHISININNLDFNTKNVGLPVQFLYDVFFGKQDSIIIAEIVNHGFGEKPDGYNEIEDKKVTINFRRTNNSDNYDEYVLTLQDNGYGFSGKDFKLKGNLKKIKEKVRDWCEEFYIETIYCKDNGRFKYDLFNEKEIDDCTIDSSSLNSHGTIYSFIFRVREFVI